uniref:YqaJ domain-containing protein n=1 Tax=Anopheles epiroticus TaxID=199890 RepID=A0A182PIZ6_9DIPT
MALDMALLLQIPKLDLESVKLFLEQNHITNNSSVKLRRTRKYTFNSKMQWRQHSKVSFENITVTGLTLDETATGSKDLAQRTLMAEVLEVPVKVGRRKNLSEKQHRIMVTFTGNRQNVTSVSCLNCAASKGVCSAISSFMYWVQQKQTEILSNEDQENAVTEENAAKKGKIVRVRVVLQRVELNALQEQQKTPEPVSSPPALKKVQKQTGPITPEQLEKARQLSMVQLIRDFKGDDVNEFLKFCTERMSGGGVCDSIPLLTIEQAETNLWHELRVGRITASRIREAARCTMLNGSLASKIMGQSSGFSMAMKRGTDLEGHVLAELRKQYPGLRDTGLILDPACPWMGASPDGICEEFVLEIKCPYTAKTHACYVDVEKLSPKYFAQIQLQMHVTHRTKALLAVAALDFESTRNVTQVWIEYDKAYVDDVMESAYEFWCKSIFKALLRKRTSKK